jgi:hypothetical protein
MGDDVIGETQQRLEQRLEELRPALEEAARIQAALAALKTGPRPPVTVLDTLKPVPPEADQAQTPRRASSSSAPP